MQSLIEQTAPKVRYHAHRTHRRVFPHLELDDLMQEGYVAVLDALQRFSSAKGAQFTTFANHRIQGAMLDYIRHEVFGPQLRPGVEANLPVMESLDVPATTLRKTLRAESPLPDEVAMRSELVRAIYTQVAKLPERTQLLFALIYGVADMTFAEAGERLGISESRVSQLHTAAVALIRAGLKERALCQ